MKFGVFILFENIKILSFVIILVFSFSIYLLPKCLKLKVEQGCLLRILSLRGKRRCDVISMTRYLGPFSRQRESYAKQLPVHAYGSDMQPLIYYFDCLGKRYCYEKGCQEVNQKSPEYRIIGFQTVIQAPKTKWLHAEPELAEVKSQDQICAY